MQRGTITILLILTVAVLAATASVFYHYANQRHAQDFWGAQTAALIDKAATVEVMRLGEADVSLPSTEDAPPENQPTDATANQPADNNAEGPATDSAQPGSEGETAEPPAPDKAVEFNEKVWFVLDTRDAAPAKGISNLRRALVLDTTYNWSDVPPESDPVWQYALAVTDGRDWATVLFDFDSRRVGLSGGRKVAMLHAEAAQEFKGFFEEQFAAEPPAKPSESAAPEEASPPADAPAS